MTELTEPLELAFVWDAINRWDNFYHLCSNHCESDRNDDSANTYPFQRFDLKDALFDKENPDDMSDQNEWSLEERMFDRLREDFEDEQRYLEEEHGFKPIFDINGYRIMPKLPIYYLHERMEEIKDEFNNAEDQDERDEIKEEWDEKCQELVKCGKKLMIFEEWLEKFKANQKYSVEEMVFAWNTLEEKYEVFDCIDYYLDFKDEWQLIRWTPEGMIDEREAGWHPNQKKILEFCEVTA